MATLRKSITLSVSPAQLWDAVRDVGAAHRRLAPGFVTNCALADGVRTVTFANGMTVREPIVSIDDAARRVAYTAEGGRAKHYAAAMQVMDGDDGSSRLSWQVDLLPDDMAPAIESMMVQGIQVIRRHFDGM